MKKINLFISALMICLAILVACGATVPALQFQAQAMAVRTASNSDGDLKGIDLFDSEGRYAVSQADLAVGTVVKFFGHDWYVVYVNEAEKVATFWMTDPYGEAQVFNATTRSGHGLFKDGTNIWLNGYTQNYWENAANDQGPQYLGQSQIREYLSTQATAMIENNDYASYKAKVVSGCVEGSNESNNDANKKIPFLAYSDESIDQVEELVEATNELTAYYHLGDNERLWLPSVKEIDQIWNLPNSMLGWTETTISNRAWLRTPDFINNGDTMKGESCYAMAVCSDQQGTTRDSYFVARAVKQVAGVRPAIHMSIENIDDEYQAHLDAVNNGGKGGWFNDDWLKALFIVVCILGLVGVGLVIIAVILKARKNKAEAQQA